MKKNKKNKKSKKKKFGKDHLFSFLANLDADKMFSESEFFKAVKITRKRLDTLEKKYKELPHNAKLLLTVRISFAAWVLKKIDSYVNLFLKKLK